jgi:hypothetical protein
MPRNGAGVYSTPVGTDAISDQTIESTKYNVNTHDVETDLNLPRPIVAGGTGATNAHDALVALSGEMSNQVVTNYDTFQFMSGSFVSFPGAISAPSSNGASGICYVYLPNQYITLEARDVLTAVKFVRRMNAGVWEPSWTFQQNAADKVAKAGDTMTGTLIIADASPALSLQKSTAGGNNDIFGFKDTQARWLLRLGDSVTEAGGNLGANFKLIRYNDGGGAIDAAIEISRSDGRVLLNGDPISPLHASTKQYTDNTGLAKVAKAGDTMTGSLTISVASYPNLTINKGTGGSASMLIGTRAGLQRWMVMCGNDTAESGSNTGSDFEIRRCDDGGTQLGTSLAINRASGIVAHAKGVTIGSWPLGSAVANTAIGYGGGGSEFGITLRPSIDNTSAVVFYNVAGAGVGSISVTPTATAYNTSSDERLKEDFQTFDAGRVVDDTNVYSFRWKSTGGRSYGISAQQAQEVFPQAVTYVKEQDWYGIDYSKYVPVLLNELKALRARVAQLEAGMASKPA